jgi:hypothetical protein
MLTPSVLAWRAREIDAGTDEDQQARHVVLPGDPEREERGGRQLISGDDGEKEPRRPCFA